MARSPIAKVAGRIPSGFKIRRLRRSGPAVSKRDQLRTLEKESLPLSRALGSCEPELRAEFVQFIQDSPEITKATMVEVCQKRGLAVSPNASLEAVVLTLMHNRGVFGSFAKIGSSPKKKLAAKKKATPKKRVPKTPKRSTALKPAVGETKISFIKRVRETKGLGLVEAKDFADKAFSARAKK